MNNINFFLGYPVNFQNKCLVYPPTLEDALTNPDFQLFLFVLTLSQEEIEDNLTERKIDISNAMTPLETLLSYCAEDKIMLEKMQNAFEFFLHKKAVFLYDVKKIMLTDLNTDLTSIKNLNDLILIDEQDYFDLQNLIRDACGFSQAERPNPNEHPRVKRMKAKARYRDKIKAKQGLGIKLSSTITSICCMGVGLNPLNIGKLSYCALNELIRVYQKKEKYELDIQSLLAGADSKKIKPQYWINND